MKYILQKLEILTTFCQPEVNKPKLHEIKYIQPTEGGQLTPTESGQGNWFMQ
jgi:hypothetical protein